jgi:hypothetical protein
MPVADREPSRLDRERQLAAFACLHTDDRDLVVVCCWQVPDTLSPLPHEPDVGATDSGRVVRA